MILPDFLFFEFFGGSKLQGLAFGNIAILIEFF